MSGPGWIVAGPKELVDVGSFCTTFTCRVFFPDLSPWDTPSHPWLRSCLLVHRISDVHDENGPAVVCACWQLCSTTALGATPGMRVPPVMCAVLCGAWAVRVTRGRISDIPTCVRGARWTTTYGAMRAREAVPVQKRTARCKKSPSGSRQCSIFSTVIDESMPRPLSPFTGHGVRQIVPLFSFSSVFRTNCRVVLYLILQQHAHVSRLAGGPRRAAAVLDPGMLVWCWSISADITLSESKDVMRPVWTSNAYVLRRSRLGWSADLLSHAQR